MTETPTTALRGAKRKGKYKAQFDQTVRNAVRRLRRHLRSCPDDSKAAKIYQSRGYGDPKALTPTSRGRHRLARRVFLESLRTSRGLFEAMGKEDNDVRVG